MAEYYLLWLKYTTMREGKAKDYGLASTQVMRFRLLPEEIDLCDHP